MTLLYRAGNTEVAKFDMPQIKRQFNVFIYMSYRPSSKIHKEFLAETTLQRYTIFYCD